MEQPQINIEFRTTWIMPLFNLFCWIESKRLLKLLDNAIFARIYVNGKLSKELRFGIVGKNQITIRGDFPGGSIKNISDMKL